MTIYELARQLGEEILKTPQTERILKAKDAYQADEESVKLINDYSKMQKAYQEKLQDPNLTKEEYQEATEKLMEQTEKIKGNPITAELINAENDFNQYVNSIFSIVTSTIAGEDTSNSCGGGGCDSASCGSCCGCH